LDHEGAIEAIYHEMANFRYAAETIRKEGWAVDLWEGERLESMSLTSYIVWSKEDVTDEGVITSDAGLQETKKSLEAFMSAKAASPTYKDYPLYHELIEDPAEVLKVRFSPETFRSGVLMNSYPECQKQKPSSSTHRVRSTLTSSSLLSLSRRYLPVWSKPFRSRPSRASLGRMESGK
jgi:hypothetical protein